MAARWYCVQFCHSMKGWIDLPSLASKREKEANDAAQKFAEANHVVCRVIRKPHSWEPPEPSNVEKLWNAQAIENDGRGISCVRSMVQYLMADLVEDARSVRRLARDKTRAYPNVEKLLIEIFGCRLHECQGCQDCDL